MVYILIFLEDSYLNVFFLVIFDFIFIGIFDIIYRLSYNYSYEHIDIFQTNSLLFFGSLLLAHLYSHLNTKYRRYYYERNFEYKKIRKNTCKRIPLRERGREREEKRRREREACMKLFVLRNNCRGRTSARRRGQTPAP